MIANSFVFTMWNISRINSFEVLFCSQGPGGYRKLKFYFEVIYYEHLCLLFCGTAWKVFFFSSLSSSFTLSFVVFSFVFFLHFSPPLTGVLSWGVKWPVSEPNHSSASGTEVKTVWSYTSTHTYVYVAWCLIKPRATLSFIFLHFNFLNNIAYMYVAVRWGCLALIAVTSVQCKFDRPKEKSKFISTFLSEISENTTNVSWKICRPSVHISTLILCKNYN